jgi:hypothetical protein
LNKEDIWEPIYIELEKKSLEQIKKWVSIWKKIEKEISRQIRLMGAKHKL